MHSNQLPVAERALATYAKIRPVQWCRGLFGYMHSVKGVPLSELSMRSVLPSSDRAGVAAAFDYLQCLAVERETNVRTQAFAARAILAVSHHTYNVRSIISFNTNS